MTQEDRDKSRHRSDVRKARERELIDDAFAMLDDEGLVAYLKTAKNPMFDMEGKQLPDEWEFLWPYIEWADRTNKHAKLVTAAKVILKAHADYVTKNCL